ncbi:MAG: carbon-nitrogen hydrolase family protein [Pseudomonadota bacterium]
MSAVATAQPKTAAGGDTGGRSASAAKPSGQDERPRKTTVRVASVQLALQSTSKPDAFFRRIAHHVRVAGEYGCDFVCFPEHLTLQLLSGDEPMTESAQTVDALTGFTDIWRSTLSDLAKRHSVNIIGGSHATRLDDGSARNVSFIAHRGGSVDVQAKIHPTPDERDVWGIIGGRVLEPIDTDCGPIGVLICYDSEFPELARRLVDQNEIGLLFVPYCTDTRAGHLRVHYCCQARAIENQFHVVTSGLVGTLENVANLEMAYAQSTIMTPSDHGFARDGIAAQAEVQIEQMIFADLDLSALEHARREGSVQNLADRRDDLYGVQWRD